MTLLHTNLEQKVHRNVAKLFTATLMTMMAFILSLLWLWKLSILAPGVKVVVFYLGLFGACGYVGTLIVLLRLRRNLRDDRMSSPSPQA